MKNIIAIAGAFALAACGGNAEEPDAESDAETAEVEAPEDTGMVAAGTYTEMDTIADPQVITLAADGSFNVSSGDEVSESGSWEQNDDGVCLTAEGASESCFSVAEGEEGVRTITGADGSAVRYSYAGE